MDRDTFRHLDVLLHRIERLIGDIETEKKSFDDRMDMHIRDLLIAKSEILNLVEDDREEAPD